MNPFVLILFAVLPDLPAPVELNALPPLPAAHSCPCGASCRCVDCDGKCAVSKHVSETNFGNIGNPHDPDFAAARRDLLNVAQQVVAMQPKQQAAKSKPLAYPQPTIRYVPRGESVCRPGMPCYKPQKRGLFGRVIGQ